MHFSKKFWALAGLAVLGSGLTYATWNGDTGSWLSGNFNLVSSTKETSVTSIYEKMSTEDLKKEIPVQVSSAQTSAKTASDAETAGKTAYQAYDSVALTKNQVAAKKAAKDANQNKENVLKIVAILESRAQAETTKGIIEKSTEIQSDISAGIEEKAIDFQNLRTQYETSVSKYLENIELYKVTPTDQMPAEDLAAAKESLSQATQEFESAKNAYQQGYDSLKAALESASQQSSSLNIQGSNLDIQATLGALESYDTERQALETSMQNYLGSKSTDLNAKSDWVSQKNAWATSVKGMATQKNQILNTKGLNLKNLNTTKGLNTTTTKGINSQNLNTKILNNNIKNTNLKSGASSKWLQNSVLGSSAPTSAQTTPTAPSVSSPKPSASSSSTISNSSSSAATSSAYQTEIDAVTAAAETAQNASDDLNSYELLSCKMLSITPQTINLGESENSAAFNVNVVLTESLKTHHQWKGKLTVQAPEPMTLNYAGSKVNPLQFDLKATSSLAITAENITESGTLTLEVDQETACQSSLVIKKASPTVPSSTSGTDTPKTSAGSESTKPASSDPQKDPSVPKSSDSKDKGGDTSKPVDKSVFKNKNTCQDPFEDTNGEWFDQPICLTYASHAVNGRSSKTFVPDGAITRAEAIKIIDNLLVDENTTASSKTSFTDVYKADWYYSYLTLAEAQDIIRTRDFGLEFKPNDFITRGDLALYIARALELKSYSFEAPFSDVKSTDYFAYAVSILSQKKVDLTWDDKGPIAVIEGYSNGKFEPKKSINRAEALTIIYRAFMAYKE